VRRCYREATGVDDSQWEGATAMAVARVTEISSTSSKSFEDAIQQGVARATKTLRNVRSAWIKEQRVDVRNDQIAEYQVNMMVTFVLDD
jgi:hypothetical protein